MTTFSLGCAAGGRKRAGRVFAAPVRTPAKIIRPRRSRAFPAFPSGDFFGSFQARNEMGPGRRLGPERKVGGWEWARTAGRSEAEPAPEVVPEVRRPPTPESHDLVGPAVGVEL